MLSTAFSEIFWMTSKTLILHQNVFFTFSPKIGEKIKAMGLNALYIPNPALFITSLMS